MNIMNSNVISHMQGDIPVIMLVINLTQTKIIWVAAGRERQETEDEEPYTTHVANYSKSTSKHNIVTKLISKTKITSLITYFECFN